MKDLITFGDCVRIKQAIPFSVSKCTDTDSNSKMTTFL